MRYLEILTESTSRTLYHGTLKQNVPDILKNRLHPKVGAFTKQFYEPYEDDDGHVEELSELVFAADKQGLQKCAEIH